MIASRLAWLPPLLVRATVGMLFVLTGWTATHTLGEVTDYFAKLGIPLPHANAILVSFGELVCGALLVVGLFAREASIPLIVFMVVALATAKAPAIHGLEDLLLQPELGYVVMLAGLAIYGSGRLSLDHRRRSKQ